VDLFLDRELAPGQAATFAGHLETCPELAELVSQRTALRTRVRAAAAASETPAGLEQKIRSRLSGDTHSGDTHSGHTGHKPLGPWLAVAAALLLAFGSLLSWRNGGLRWTSGAQESYIASVSQQVSPVMRIGLKQHVHCAVFRKHPSPPPSGEELARELGPGYADLIPAMQRRLPQHFRVVEAHRCSYQGREYAHLIATDGSAPMSLLITGRAQGEALENDLRAVAATAGESLYTASVQRFSIAGFETSRYLIYLVSDLDSRQNIATLESMVPEVAGTIRTTGS
jgi:anti-sigma factor RsiW